MRYTGFQVWGLITITACAGAQAAPTTSTTPSPAAQERVVREREVAERARERSEQVRARTERVRLRADSLRVRAQARALAADSALMNRASLGVTLSNTGTRRDTLGIFVSAVATGGPAERAGIVEGDRIASINGVDVRTQGSDADDSYLAGVAQRRFTLELRKLTPGQRANLRVWSGGRYREVQVTTARYTEVYRNRRTSIRIGEGNFMPFVAPSVHGAPLAPGRIMMPAPNIAPLRRLDVLKLDEALDAAAGALADVSIELPKLAGEALGAVAMPLAELEWEGFGEAMAPLDDLEFELLDQPLLPFEELEEPLLELDRRLDAPLNFNQLEYELDAAAPIEIEELADEALRQANETVDVLERQVTSR